MRASRRESRKGGHRKNPNIHVENSSLMCERQDSGAQKASASLHDGDSDQFIWDRLEYP